MPELWCPECRKRRTAANFYIESMPKCGVCGGYLTAPPGERGKLVVTEIVPMETFTWLDPHDESYALTFNVELMNRAAAMRPLPDGIVEIEDWLDKHFALFILDNRGIEGERIARLREPHLSKPVLLCAMPDGTHLMVDGHHRYVKLLLEGREKIRGYMFSEVAWRPFIVEVPEHVKQRVIAEIKAQPGDGNDAARGRDRRNPGEGRRN